MTQPSPPEKKRLPCPSLELLESFASVCSSTPHFLRLSKHKKTPVDKGWPDHPWTIDELAGEIDKFDVGLMPSSISMVVVDNDSGREAFFEYLKDTYGDALVAITPSSSDTPGRGHAWIACSNPEDVRSKKVYFEGQHVGEIRCHRTQIRLVGKAVEHLLASDDFIGVPINEPFVTADDIHRLTDGKNLDPKSQRPSPNVITFGEDTGRKLPEDLAKQLQQEFRETTDRSRSIDRWCWRLRWRRFSPAEIYRVLEPIKRVRDRVQEKGRELKADILTSCTAFDDLKAREVTADFDENALFELKDWVFVAKREEFIRLTDGETLSERQFRHTYKHLFGKKDPLNEVMANRTPVRKFRTAVYIPNGPRFLEEAVNLWTPSDVSPNEGDVSLFLQLIENMIPDPEEREIFLDILHFYVCRPEEKLMFAPIVVTRPGVGKSTLGNILTSLIGEQNVSHPQADDIQKDWSDWQLNKSLAIVHEMMMNDRRDVSARLKSIITDKRLRIHRKYARPYYVDNCLNFLAFSNYDNAVYLEPHDRRWVVFSADVEPPPSAFFDTLNDWLKDPSALGAIKNWLQKREPTINPTGHAPMTQAKKAMAYATMPEWKRQIERWLEDHDGPFADGLFHFEEVLDALRSKRHTPSSEAVKQVLIEHGAQQLTRSVVRGRRCYTFWTIRDHDMFEAMSHLDRINHFESRRILA